MTNTIGSQTNSTKEECLSSGRALRTIVARSSRPVQFATTRSILPVKYFHLSASIQDILFVVDMRECLGSQQFIPHPLGKFLQDQRIITFPFPAMLKNTDRISSGKIANLASMFRAKLPFCPQIQELVQGISAPSFSVITHRQEPLDRQFEEFDGSDIQDPNCGGIEGISYIHLFPHCMSVLSSPRTHS